MLPFKGTISGKPNVTEAGTLVNLGSPLPATFVPIAKIGPVPFEIVPVTLPVEVAVVALRGVARFTKFVPDGQAGEPPPEVTVKLHLQSYCYYPH